ncbi:1-acyl-sn-glycerol-3-phosphate acyltransferase [Nitratireductor basaltis]|uniref:AMP-dependent synthetase and ligase n=1 Tax=Nitratireductor basaltis TaxID=472175 RepID=A0A084UC71_9HYPH|nr:1-acyl-sn-glycerol-3-phosphate acyltransferase [Nitratireductor basaltis]KFB10557.1 AMP-dependent synthetase and ligase [Nitratireductor basaltis]
MHIAIAVIIAISALWVALAAFAIARLGIGFKQALLYVPFKLWYRISDRQIHVARNAPTPVIYAVWHQSRLDPALMLSLLPEDTLHILDEASARSWWLDPWRGLGRCISFNARHVFVSRRLVQRLKGGGRLAVYLPDDTSPDKRSFRLFRAIARIAMRADAQVVPIYVKGSEKTAFSLSGGSRLLPALSVRTLEPVTLETLKLRSQNGELRASQALLNRMLEARGIRIQEEERVEEAA